MEKVEKYVLAPSLSLYGAVVVKKDTNFEVYNDEQTVHQIVKDLKLITEIDREYGDDYKTKEKSVLEQELPENTLLVWIEDSGYVIPQTKMCSVDKAINDLSLLKGE